MKTEFKKNANRRWSKHAPRLLIASIVFGALGLALALLQVTLSYIRYGTTGHVHVSLPLPVIALASIAMSVWTGFEWWRAGR